MSLVIGICCTVEHRIEPFNTTWVAHRSSVSWGTNLQRQVSNSSWPSAFSVGQTRTHSS